MVARGTSYPPTSMIYTTHATNDFHVRQHFLLDAAAALKKKTISKNVSRYDPFLEIGRILISKK